MSAALLQQFDHSGRCRGGTINFPTWGLTLQTGGAKIRFSGYYKCQKSPKMVSHLPTGRLSPPLALYIGCNIYFLFYKKL